MRLFPLGRFDRLDLPLERDQLLGRPRLRIEGRGARRQEDPPQLAERAAAGGGFGRAVEAAHAVAGARACMQEFQWRRQ